MRGATPPEHAVPAGLGTLVARLLPFTLVFLTAWTAVLLVFWGLDLPVGPGNGIRLG